MIYCSLLTANLVNQQLGVDRKHLHPIAMDMPTIVMSGNKQPVTFTLLDANHCPGAVMFLFEVGGVRILHVGDFRWDRELGGRCATRGGRASKTLMWQQGWD